MSDIRVDTISAADGTSPVTLTKQSAAKAWINFNGVGTISTQDSLNVASLIDHAAGTYGLNMASNFNTAGFAATSTADGTGGYAMRCTTCSQHTVSSLVYRVSTLTGPYPGSDNAVCQVVIHGDLA